MEYSIAFDGEVAEDAMLVCQKRILRLKKEVIPQFGRCLSGTNFPL